MTQHLLFIFYNIYAILCCLIHDPFVLGPSYLPDALYMQMFSCFKSAWCSFLKGANSTFKCQQKCLLLLNWILKVAFKLFCLCNAWSFLSSRVYIMTYLDYKIENKIISWCVCFAAIAIFQVTQPTTYLIVVLSYGPILE